MVPVGHRKGTNKERPVDKENRMNISALLVPDAGDKRTHNNKGRGHAWRATLQDKAPRPSEFQVTMSFTLSVSHTWARGGGGRGPRAGKCAPPR